MALEITDATFDSTISQPGLTVIDFWAEWCGPCRMVGPVIEELAKEYEGKVVIGKCDVDTNSEAPRKLGVRGIPAIIFFKDGKEVDRVTGAKPKAELSLLIEKHLA